MINIQFSHANGFPAESYNCLFKYLKADKINYVSAFGLEKYKVKRNWQALVQELINDIEQDFTNPIIGIGHSLGALLTLLAAHRRPELFSRLILMEPPIFSPLKRWVVAGLNLTNNLDKIPHPANKSKLRRDYFESKEEAFEYFKGKTLFKDTKPECLQDYVSAGLKEASKGGFELFIPRSLEYKIFTTMPLFIPSKRLPMPVDLFFSNKFEAMTAKDFASLRKHFSYIHFTEMNGGHLFPLEIPQETAKRINSIIYDKK